ncbi:Tetracycline resistance protein, class A [Symbiodinium microadriaticum]|uniref:Tetracycline resistance protein, class A n=1 Tax=Symbiodinium microadriaticum TaxID=2951 RepID=A0A1Q9CYC3_SYMMI|nr:Tetracycline resistance protein, class A [Symbiodinium microadriaticum]CAE7870106.1 tetA [Symbiodinium microadriaticum]
MSESESIENSTDFEPASNDSDDDLKKVGVDLGKACQQVYCSRHLLVLFGLGTLQQLIGPCVPYIIGTFFAAQYGGGDCEVNPSSEPCRRAATFAALVFGWSNAAANLVAMLLAVCLGSCSDVLGRRPLIRAFGVATMLPCLALALHVTTGITLWIFLVLQPLVECFDINGVYLAVMADAIDDPQERAAAFGAFMAACMLLVGLVVPFGFILPSVWLIRVSVIAGTVKLVYLFFVFPESAKHKSFSPLAPEEEQSLVSGKMNPISSACSAFSLLNRNAFIARLAMVLVCAGLAASGYAIVMPPFMMGYLGYTRSNKLILVCAMAISALVSFTCLLGPAVKKCGQVRVLQHCLAASVIVPFLVAFCQEQWQLALICFLFAGPIALAVPLVQALKSMLVSPAEQGLVQGAVASMSKGAATVGFVVFSTMFAFTSGGGKVDSVGAVLPSFALIAGIFAISAILAGTLPSTPPQPLQDDKLLLDSADSGPDC